MLLLLSNILDLIDGFTKDVQRSSLNTNGEDTDALLKLLFPHRNSLELYQKLHELERSTLRRESKDNIVTDTAGDGQTDRPVDVIGSVKKTAKAVRTPDDDIVDVDERPTKRAKRAPKKQKVRISAENLPKVLQAKKRASEKARRTIVPHRISGGRSSMKGRKSSVGPHRISGGPPPKNSMKMKKRKTSIGPNSKAIKPPTSDPKPFKCAVFGCAYAGARAGYLKTHMKGHDKDKLVGCKKCDMKFKSADGILLAKHSADHK